MKCLSCESQAELVESTRDMPYSYKGQDTVISDVTGCHCESCGEVIMSREETVRVSAAMREFSKQVNGAIVDPGFIVRVRTKLDLGQKEASILFGGGINAFSRYETGNAKPSLALVQLFKVLDRHPELIEELKTA